MNYLFNARLFALKYRDSNKQKLQYRTHDPTEETFLLSS